MYSWEHCEPRPLCTYTHPHRRTALVYTASYTHQHTLKIHFDTGTDTHGNTHTGRHMPTNTNTGVSICQHAHTLTHTETHRHIADTRADAYRCTPTHTWIPTHMPRKRVSRPQQGLAATGGRSEREQRTAGHLNDTLGSSLRAPAFWRRRPLRFRGSQGTAGQSGSRGQGAKDFELRQPLEGLK